jgi:hypothetical protein
MFATEGGLRNCGSDRVIVDVQLRTERDWIADVARVRAHPPPLPARRAAMTAE